MLPQCRAYRHPTFPTNSAVASVRLGLFFDSWSRVVSVWPLKPFIQARTCSCSCFPTMVLQSQHLSLSFPENPKEVWGGVSVLGVSLALATLQVGQAVHCVSVMDRGQED